MANYHSFHGLILTELVVSSMSGVGIQERRQNPTAFESLDFSKGGINRSYLDTKLFFYVCIAVSEGGPVVRTAGWHDTMIQKHPGFETLKRFSNNIKNKTRTAGKKGGCWAKKKQEHASRYLVQNSIVKYTKM